MQITKVLKFSLITATIVFVLLSLHGCKVPGMHQPEIEQGNIVTQKMVDRLRPNMTKAQVEFVLGRPVYQNTFDVNRWDYIFTRESRTGERVRRLLTLKFEDDELVAISGDYRPEGDAVDELEQLVEPIEDTNSEDTDSEDTVAEEEEESNSEDSDEEDEVKVHIPNR